MHHTLSIEELGVLADCHWPSFPISCSGCGQLYTDLGQFIHKSESMTDSSGIEKASEQNGVVIMQLTRQCPCGATMLSVSTPIKLGNDPLKT